MRKVTRWNRPFPDGVFAADGPLDTRVPSALLAALADAVTRDGHLARLTDDELVGVMRAWRRLESWCGAGLLAAIAELGRRRPADRTPAAGPGEFPDRISEFLGDEVAAALTLTSRAADATCTPGVDLGVRLPAATAAAAARSADMCGSHLSLVRSLTVQIARICRASYGEK